MKPAYNLLKSPFSAESQSSRRAPICIKELTDGLCRLSSGYLRGILHLTVIGDSLDAVTLSALYTSHMLKLMAKYANGGLLDINVEISEQLVMKCSFPNGMPTGRAISDIYSCALKAGFKIAPSEASIILWCNLEKSTVISLYSKSDDLFYKILCDVFDE